MAASSQIRHDANINHVDAASRSTRLTSKTRRAVVRKAVDQCSVNELDDLEAQVERAETILVIAKPLRDKLRFSLQTDFQS